MKKGDIITLRRASYIISSDRVSYMDTLLGQFQVGSGVVSPLGHNKIAKPLLISNIGRAVGNLENGSLVYGDSMEPDVAKTALFDKMRDMLENERMRLNKKVAGINSLLEKIEEEL